MDRLDDTALKSMLGAVCASERRQRRHRRHCQQRKIRSGQTAKRVLRSEKWEVRSERREVRSER